MKARQPWKLLVVLVGATAASCGGEDLAAWDDARMAASTPFSLVAAASNHCLDVAGAGRSNGTNIQIWSCNGSGAQSFRTEDLGSGRVRLVNVNSNKCVDVAGAGTANGTNIQLWKCNGSGAQSFRIEDLGSGQLRLINTRSGKCVDVAGAGTAQGTNVQLWTCNGTAAQSWRFAGTSDDTGSGRLTNRAASIPIGIENVNDSPLKAASYRTLIRFVPDQTISIDRFYFGFKLRGASCWDSGNAGYGAGDGGLLDAALVNVDPVSGLPAATIASERINACSRHREALTAFGSTPVLAWVNTRATLEGGKMYGLVVRNAHSDPPRNFFSINLPLADTILAGPHARNVVDKNTSGGILGLDPREHVAWSSDGGKSWLYGSQNGQYRSYMNDRDTAHPATRMPQYGFRLTSGATLAVQPYYAYSIDCTGCSVTYANARYARVLSEAGGFTASGTNIGTLTVTNTATGARASCSAPQGYGFRRCTLSSPISVAVGQSFTVRASGSVEVMEMDNSQRVLFPGVGTASGDIRIYQAAPAPGTNAKDVPSLWAGPLSIHHP